jgi:hypothetical protein
MLTPGRNGVSAGPPAGTPGEANHGHRAGLDDVGKDLPGPTEGSRSTSPTINMG